MKFALLIIGSLICVNIASADTQWTCVDPNTNIQLTITERDNGTVIGEISNYLSTNVELSCQHETWQDFDCEENRPGTDQFGAFLVLGDTANGGAKGAVYQKDGVKPDGTPKLSKLIASFNDHRNCTFR